MPSVFFISGVRQEGASSKFRGRKKVVVKVLRRYLQPEAVKNSAPVILHVCLRFIEFQVK